MDFSGVGRVNTFLLDEEDGDVIHVPSFTNNHRDGSISNFGDLEIYYFRRKLVKKIHYNP